MLTLETPHGPAQASLQLVDAPVGALVLGHGAGGGVNAPDLQAAAKAAREAGFGVVLVEQPYRVAGKRTPPRAPVLDESWVAVVSALAGGELRGLPLVTGGRSSGARVACRTAAATASVGVLCLAFPVHPPGKPEASRLPELDGVTVPALVVQGTSDPFGMPPDGPNRRVVRLAGDHGLKKDLPALSAAVGAWLSGLV